MATTAPSASTAALTLGLTALLSTACDPGGWRRVDSPTDKTLRGVFVETPERVFITGDDGTVLFFDGTTVTDTSTVVRGVFDQPDFYGIAASGREVVVAGDEGQVFARRADVWSRDQSNTQRRMLTVIRPAPSYFLAGGESGRVIVRDTASDTWQHLDVHAPSGAKITGGWGNSRESIILATSAGAVLEKKDGDWVAENVVTDTSTGTVPLFGVWTATRGADLVAVGLGGSIFRRIEGTVGWGAEGTRVTQDLYGVFGVAPDAIWAVGASGTVLRYDGSAWAAVPSASAADLHAIHGTASGELVVAVGDRGTIMILKDRND